MRNNSYSREYSIEEVNAIMQQIELDKKLDYTPYTKHVSKSQSCPDYIKLHPLTSSDIFCIIGLPLLFFVPFVGIMCLIAACCLHGTTERQPAKIIYMQTDEKHVK